MWIAIFLLAAAVLGAGGLVGVVPAARTGQWLKPLLAFSGAYLLTLTITHLLPEALTLLPATPTRVGYWMLAGFFGQLLLEVVSQGIEHGHVHAPMAAEQGRVPFLLVVALVVHSVLEGSILVRDAGSGEVGRHFYALVLGIALHHVPAAVALATLLRLRLGSFGRVWPWLVVFALASPAGLVFSNYVVLKQLLAAACTRRCWASWRARFSTFRPPFCLKPVPSTASTGPSWGPRSAACYWRWR